MLDVNAPSSLLDVSVENDMGVLVMYQSIRRWVTVSLPKDLNLPQFRDKKNQVPRLAQPKRAISQTTTLCKASWYLISHTSLVTFYHRSSFRCRPKLVVVSYFSGFLSAHLCLQLPFFLTHLVNAYISLKNPVQISSLGEDFSCWVSFSELPRYFGHTLVFHYLWNTFCIQSLKLLLYI